MSMANIREPYACPSPTAITSYAPMMIKTTPKESNRVSKSFIGLQKYDFSTVVYGGDPGLVFYFKLTFRLFDGVG